jgi:hypothetical protein
LRNNLWRSTSYGQNLGFKEFTGRCQDSTNARAPRCVGVRNNGVASIVGARADVTIGCGKRPMVLIRGELWLAEKGL